MIHLELGTARIFVRPGATDMRKQINGLVVLVQEEMQTSPFETALFVFCNAQRRLLKAVYWDRTGFCLWMKRLEKGRFPWPRTCGEAGRRQNRQPRQLIDSGHIVCGRNGADEAHGEPLHQETRGEVSYALKMIEGQVVVTSVTESKTACSSSVGAVLALWFVRPTTIKALGGVAPSARDPHRGEFLLGMGWARIVKRARGSIGSR